MNTSLRLLKLVCITYWSGLYNILHWSELIAVLERVRLVWTRLAAKFTECTCMKLGGKLLNSLRIKTHFLERLQSVSVGDGATHTQKDNVESNGGSLEIVAEVFVLFLCGVQLILRSGVLTVLDLDEVDVTPMFAEV